MAATIATIEMYATMSKESSARSLAQALSNLIEEAQLALRDVDRGRAPTKVSALTNLVSEVTRHSATLEVSLALVGLVAPEAPKTPVA